MTEFRNHEISPSEDANLSLDEQLSLMLSIVDLNMHDLAPESKKRTKQTIKSFFHHLAEVQKRPNEDGIRSFFHAASEQRAGTRRVLKYSLKRALSELPTFKHNIANRAALDQLFREIKLPRRRMAVFPEKLLNTHEITQIRAYFRNGNQHDFRTGMMIEALLDTGCRISEILNAKHSDLTLFPGHGSLRVTGKGGIEREVHLKLQTIQAVKAIYNHPTSPFLLHTRTGKKMQPDSAWSKIRRVGKYAIGREVHPHMLRHTKARMMEDAGLNPKAIAMYLGHAQIATYLAMYSHPVLTPDMTLS